MFGNEAKSDAATTAMDIKTLHAKIGQLALESILRLQSLPDLSAPFSLTPIKPVIPGVAKLDYYGVAQFTGGNLDDPSDQGSVEFCEHVACAATALGTSNNTFSESAWLTYHAMPGKHYAFDCRI